MIINLLAFYCLAILSSKLQGIYHNNEPKVYPPKVLNKVHLGFADVLADTLWLRLIQDFDYCENETAEKASNPGVGVDEVLSFKMHKSRCNKGWVYQMLDVITDLSPSFKRAYRVGGDILSVGVDDREGARLIYDKGTALFPNYWQLSYSAAYHYLYEIQNPNKAAYYLVQAADAGGPPWLRQMAGTLYTKAGRFMVAEVTLKKFIHENEGKRSYERGLKRLQELYDKMGIKKDAKEVIAKEKEQMLKLSF